LTLAAAFAAPEVSVSACCSQATWFELTVGGGGGGGGGVRKVAQKPNWINYLHTRSNLVQYVAERKRR